MDVVGPSALNTTLKKPRKVYKNKSENKPTEKSTTLIKKNETGAAVPSECGVR
jgi:hypothetical protein